MLTNKLKNYFNSVFQLDYRALAFLRIATGILVIIDLIRRLADLSAHYSGTGIVSRNTLYLSEFFTRTPSIFLLSGEVWFQAILFLITGVSALLLIFGYKTRITTVVVWYLVLSLQTANPFVLQRGDSELIFMLFWGMFLPWNKRFSLDSAYDKNKSAPHIASPATAAFIIQVAYVYFFAFFHKCQSSVWCGDFTAVHYSFSIDAYANDLARWFLQFPDLLSLLTFMVLVIQLISLPIMLSPFKNSWCRGIIATLLLLMQLAFISTLHLGLFPYISIVVILTLYPSAVWDWLGKIIYPKKRLTIYYDQECGFCRRSVYIIRTFMLSPDTNLKTAQSDDSIWSDMQKYNSWVVVDEAGNRFFTFNAGVEIARHSPWRFILIPITSLPGINKLGEWAYRKIANNRDWIPTPSEKRVDYSSLTDDEHFKMAHTLLVILILVFITMSNVVSLTNSKLPKLGDEIMSALRLDQDWGVFAPVPNPYDGWYVVQATTSEGRVLDLLNQNRPVSYDRPDDIADKYIRQRWRKYLSNIYFGSYRFLHDDYLKWHCREYNSLNQNEFISEIELIYFLEFTTPTSTLPVKKEVLYDIKC